MCVFLWLCVVVPGSDLFVPLGVGKGRSLGVFLGRVLWRVFLLVAKSCLTLYDPLDMALVRSSPLSTAVCEPKNGLALTEMLGGVASPPPGDLQTFEVEHMSPAGM